MPARSLDVTLPPDLAEMVEGKVASGASTSESEVVGADVRALEREEEHVADEERLRRRVTESLADSRAPVAAGDVFARLRAHHGERKNARRGDNGP